jgi:hypothetical protein
MKTGTSRRLMPVLLVSALCLNASAATRVASVYAESLSALQKQLFAAAEAFQLPVLGAAPMMLAGALPGSALIDNAKPVALHVLDVGDGKTETVIEVSPTGDAEAYLKLLVPGKDGAEAALPAPENGIYKLGKGQAAKLAGGRLFFAQRSKKPAALLADGLEKLSDMPAIPGTLRVTVAPAALAPLLDGVKGGLAAAPVQGGDAEAGKKMMGDVFEFYKGVLVQMDALHIGLSVQQEGLCIRTRLAPKAGSELAAWAASGKPVTPKQLAFIEKDALFCSASGGSVLPETMKNRLLNLYVGMTAASPVVKNADTNELAKALRDSFEQQGAPHAFTIFLPAADGSIKLQGVYELADAAKALENNVAQAGLGPYKQMFEVSGLVMPEPVLSERGGMKVASFKLAFDEKLAEKAIRENLPEGQDAAKADAAVAGQLEVLKKVTGFLSGGWESGAVGKHLFFGMGEGALDAAVARVKSPGVSAEAERIEALLSPSGDPTGIGRLALSRIFALVMANDPQLAGLAKAVPPGDGVFFAGWPVKDELLSATLVSASEIKAVAALVAVGQTRSKNKTAPARPPIPENF